MDFLLHGQRALRHLLQARGVASRVVTVQGRRLHLFSMEGKGKTPIVLLHGIGGSAVSFYRTFLPLTRRFARVYAPDLPGNGFSPLPAEGPLSLEDCVEIVRAFLVEQVSAPCFLVGNSLGGAIAATLAFRHPELLCALGLVSPAGARVAEERLQALYRSFDIHTPDEARALTRQLFDRAPWPLLLFASELKKIYGTPAVRHVLAEVKPTDALAPEHLAALRMPVLLLWGEGEKLLPFESIDYFRAHLPGHAHVEVVRGFGHLPHLERPNALVQRLTGFADAHGL